MITPLICLASEGVTIDRETNQVSIFNLYEGILGLSYPFFLPRIFFFSLWQRQEDDPNEVDAEVVIKVDSTEIFRQLGKIDFRDQLKSRNVIRIDGLVIPNSGILTFDMNVKDHGVATYSVNLDAVQIPDGAIN